MKKKRIISFIAAFIMFIIVGGIPTASAKSNRIIDESGHLSDSTQTSIHYLNDTILQNHKPKSEFRILILNELPDGYSSVPEYIVMQAESLNKNEMLYVISLHNEDVGMAVGSRLDDIFMDADINHVENNATSHLVKYFKENNTESLNKAVISVITDINEILDAESSGKLKQYRDLNGYGGQSFISLAVVMGVILLILSTRMGRGVLFIIIVKLNNMRKK